MTFGQSIKTCFNKFVTAEGRASRSEFWWFLLFNYITCFCLLIGIVPLFFASIRRLHDAGHSGWWVLFPIIRIIFWCQKSQEGDNKWGPQPVD
jgi:uncharacterized membrane protein YhaH (DUF805 family)